MKLKFLAMFVGFSMIGMAQAQEDVMYFSNQTSKGSANNGQNLSAPAPGAAPVVESFNDDASNFEDVPVITVAGDQVSDYNPDDPLEIMGTSVYDGTGDLSSVTFSVESGALFIANATGHGNNTHTVTITGYNYGNGNKDESQAGIEAALATSGIQYMPVHNFKGDTSITVNAIDDAGNRAEEKTIAITVEKFPEFITASCSHEFYNSLNHYWVTYKLDPGDKVLDNVVFSNQHGSAYPNESTTEYYYVLEVNDDSVYQGKYHYHWADMFYRATFKDGSTLDRYMTCTDI